MMLKKKFNEKDFHYFTTLRVETFARRKQREIFDINFRVWWFLGQISRKKLSRIEKKVHYGGKKLSRMARSKGKTI